MFSIQGKVALVTGGASGIGLEVVTQLLTNGAKGVTIADINDAEGKTVLARLKTHFGEGKIIFVQTDVSDKKSFENAFKQTVTTFNNIDILVNNAGIYDDKNYEKEIKINLVGITHGITLSLDKYIIKHKTGSKGVIINLSSIAGVRVFPFTPVYGATKSAIISLTMALGAKMHYERTKVKVVAVAPGLTRTPILSGMPTSGLNKYTDEIMAKELKRLPLQDVEVVGRNIIKIIKEKPSGTVWISDGEGELVEFKAALPIYEVD